MPEVRRYFHQDRLNYPRGTPCQRRFRTMTRLVKRTSVQWLVYASFYVIIGLIISNRNEKIAQNCNFINSRRQDWDHLPYFNEELGLEKIDAFKEERIIKEDEEILILLGSEPRLLQSILSQHGLFDCITPSTALPSRMMQEWITVTELSQKRPELKGITHMKSMSDGSHIPESTMISAFRSYFHRLLTWQNSEKLCIVLEPEKSLGNKATTYGHTNTTILDAEILTQIFPGAKYIFVTSDPKRHIYNSFFHTTVLEKERKDTMNEYYVKNGRRGNREVEFSPAYIEQKMNTAAWSDNWTRYNNHVRKSCSNLGSSCKTLKIEDLIISPNTEMTEIYKWFGIKVDPEAIVLEQFDPTRNIEKAMPPITKPILAQKALGLINRGIRDGELDVDIDFIQRHFSQIILVENLYYPTMTDLEGSYFDESGVGFANQRRDWMKHLDLDKTGYSIYSAATYHLEGGLRKVHDFFTKHQASNTVVKELRSYNLS